MEYRIRRLIWLLLPLALCAGELDTKSIAYKIYQNECAANPKYLIHWNKGENFPSLGIGHFIWYPKGVHERFEESFPKLIRFMKAEGIDIPRWLLGAAPWQNKTQMQNDPRLSQLRRFLIDTIPQQAAFLSKDLDITLQRMLKDLSFQQQTRLLYNFQRLQKSKGGNYLLIDYRNFKGEGINPKERYKGEGWGLKQVLLCMPPKQEAKEAFVSCAKKILQRRILNAPKERHEERWKEGWFHRIDTYLVY